MQQTLSATRDRPTKGRYRTPLPFHVPHHEEVLQRSYSPETVIGYDDTRTESPDFSQAVRTTSFTSATPSVSRMSTRTTGSDGTTAALETDASLPYTRSQRITDIDRLAAQFECLDRNESPTSVRTATTSSTTTSTIKPSSTDSSKSSDPSPEILDEAHKPGERLELQNHATNMSRPQSRSHRLSTERTRVTPTSPLQEYHPVGESRTVSRQSMDYSPRPVSNYIAPRSARIEDPTLRPRIDRKAYKHPMIPPKSPRRFQDSAKQQSVQRPSSIHSVQLETVEGVRLDGRPQTSKGDRNAMPIPEIEARDIREIADLASPHDEDEQLSEFDHQPQYFASPPPPVGAIDYIQRISPKPVLDGCDHALLDRYSRAADDELPEQRSEPPKPHRSRRSHSYSMTNMSNIPTPISEEDVQSLRSTPSYTGAEPPAISRTRNFQEEEAAMSSKTHQARSLLGGMLKGLSGKSHKDRNTNHDHANHNPVMLQTDGQTFDNHEGRTYYQDDSEESEGDHGTGIWSPTTVRHSDDSYSPPEESPEGYGRKSSGAPQEVILRGSDR